MKKIACPIAWLALALPCSGGAFVPAGIAPGDVYQLIFVTDRSVQPISNSASYYNEVVNQDASLSPSMTGSNVGVEYSAIVSVPGTDARDNAMVTSPVYRMDGTLVASGATDMWDGNLQAPVLLSHRGVPALGASGDGRFPAAWTGSKSDGTVSNYDGLGSSRSVYVFGLFDHSTSSWLNGITFAFGSSDPFPAPLYALSEPLNHLGLPAIPEPTTATLLILGVMGGGMRRRG